MSLDGGGPFSGGKLTQAGHADHHHNHYHNYISRFPVERQVISPRKGERCLRVK
jgi:phosphosulfolactate synthase (CoM biosynthesis protein A)